MTTVRRMAGRLVLGLVVVTVSGCGGDDRERLTEGWELDGREVAESQFRLEAGPLHCEWDDALILNVSWPDGLDASGTRGGSFVRDPDGVMAEYATGRFVPDTTLPDEASATGYANTAGVELWLADDRATAYFVDADTVEAWPALRPWVCA